MSSLSVGMAALSLIGVALLALAMSSMLSAIRELQQSVAMLSSTRAAGLLSLADLLVENGKTAILVIEYSNPMGGELLEDLHMFQGVAILADDEQCRSWVTSSKPIMTVSRQLIRQLDLVATPTLFIVRSDGRVLS